MGLFLSIQRNCAVRVSSIQFSCSGVVRRWLQGTRRLTLNPNNCTQGMSLNQSFMVHILGRWHCHLKPTFRVGSGFITFVQGGRCWWHSRKNRTVYRLCSTIISGVAFTESWCTNCASIIITHFFCIFADLQCTIAQTSFFLQRSLDGELQL